MQVSRSLRLMFLALLVSLIPASSHAGVFISVGFAPPALPVYVQPVCPEPGLMWTPGYWAYGEDGYYWVPGAWVPAPYVGALWTPGYWGWGGGLYAWHPGYWGQHVGYYGGVNYGFGYMGVGFAGGMWRGGVFAYNGAVMHIGAGGAWGGNRVYVDRTVVERTTIINNTHVSYNGGPGGINHQPAPEERMAEHEQHVAPTSFQSRHETAARSDHGAYFNANHGRPANVAASRPPQAESHAVPEHTGGNAGFNGGAHAGGNAGFNGGAHANTEYRAAPESRPAPESHAAPQHSNPHPQEHSNPRPENRGHDEGHGHGR
ncbi:MAG TPA: YXWGXW repeat-containing protein [Terracidiphilus sp.]|jgi:hypothetical protein